MAVVLASRRASQVVRSLRCQCLSVEESSREIRETSFSRNAPVVALPPHLLLSFPLPSVYLYTRTSHLTVMPRRSVIAIDMLGTFFSLNPVENAARSCGVSPTFVDYWLTSSLRDYMADTIAGV